MLALSTEDDARRNAERLQRFWDEKWRPANWPIKAKRRLIKFNLLFQRYIDTTYMYIYMYLTSGFSSFSLGHLEVWKN